MKNKIDTLNQILERNNISLPHCSKKKEGGLNSEYRERERVHSLVVGTSISPSFIIDSGASRHMVSKGPPPIVLGDDSVTDSLGKGRIDLDHGSLNNVLYVLGLSCNLLSVYQMNHTVSLKKVIFSPDDV